MDNTLICPVCGLPVSREKGSYKCGNGHSFDIAKEGYVNLLTGNKIGGGDNRDMVTARWEFLAGGYYDCLSRKISELVHGTVLDACCGEGHFTKFIADKADRTYAFDLSKDAVKYASKRIKNAIFFVGNIARIPIADNSIDVLTHIFAPMHEECARVLKPNGTLLQVVPGKRHLWQMKEALYDNPYENDNESNLSDCFEITECIKVKDKVVIPHEQLGNILKMTPYGYKTSKEATERYLYLNELETEVEFLIYMAHKKM